ncbi:hypothetical protein M878_33390 [Streptomyces roseochromogenus subsp. oscitans DS 12.976]|uniref:Uncharacterized protein n=1 Tax=Streptomyces roseochromogenus subsp. oscitans DS 12.976 TaxID=1352936 RepID=V6K331_STRRC|nr:hypothetical protein M878_33390 [Streptomyces roseochromogenus subsp. oscitans DS 12.976]
MRPYVRGADVLRIALRALPVAVLHALIMNTEHDVTGRRLTDRLAAGACPADQVAGSCAALSVQVSGYGAGSRRAGE